MSRGRWVGASRMVITAALGGALVATAVWAPTSGGAADPSRPAASAGAGSRAPVISSLLSCPGPELSGIPGVEDIPVPARVGAATAPESVVAPVQPRGAGQLRISSGQALSVPDRQRGVTTSVDVEAPAAASVIASGSMAPGLAATQEWTMASPELRGLVTVPCSGPGSDLWLLAGGGAPGRQERLILSNPGANEVTVDLQVLGRKGVITSPTGTTVVPARGRVSLLVDAITADEESPAVRVRATGGAVRAVLTDTWLDGSIAAGAETTVPTAAPSTRQVIPAALVGTSGSIRIAVPDSAQAVVSARLIGAKGPTPLPGGGVLRVPGRSTGELSLTGLTAGRYAVELTSDVPIVASLWSSFRVGTGPGDFAWAPSTEASAGLLGAAYPSAPGERRRQVSVVSTGAPAKVTVAWRTASLWTTRELSLNRDSSAVLLMGAVEAVWVTKVSGSGDVRAAVSTDAGTPVLRDVSVSPLVDSAVTSMVSTAYPIS